MESVNNTGSQYVWVTLLLCAIGSLMISSHMGVIALLMASAWLQNTAYAMNSRAAVRNSIVYLVFASLAASAVFYATLGLLVKNNMTLALLVPYTIATVAGSLTGATISSRVESFFNITTSTTNKAMQLATKRWLAVGLGVAVVVCVALSPDNVTSVFIIIGAQWGSSASFGLVRRSRNTSNVWYHMGASILNALLWYIMFRELVTSQLPLILLAPYMFGGMMGELTGQQISMRIEQFLGAGADTHLHDVTIRFPWKQITLLLLLGGIAVFWIARDPFHALMLCGFAVAQDISFSLVSRSRNRNNIVYHAIASIFSNGVWFLTFRQVSTQHLPWDLFLPYASGRTLGSVTGVGISMQIERLVGATSDTPPPKS